MAFATKSYDNGIPYTQKFDYDGAGNVIYIGWTDRGHATSDASWKIQKLTYSGSNVTDIQWASSDFDKVWDDRTSLIYA